MKIIMGAQPQQGEYHGCPYRHQSEQSISALFGSMNITGADREKIMVHVRKQAYQVSCRGEGYALKGEFGPHEHLWEVAAA